MKGLCPECNTAHKAEDLCPLDTTMTFGKHKGKTIAEVMAEAPQYLVWAHEHVEFFSLPASIVAAAFEAATANIFEKSARRKSRITSYRLAQKLAGGPRGEYANDAYDAGLADEMYDDDY